MAAHKPLPDLPFPTNLALLSDEAQQHRARLIRHFLDQVQDGAIQSKAEEWARVFEDALDGFTLKLAQGNWLNSIRSSRQQTRAAKPDESSRDTGDRASGAEAKSKGQGKEPDVYSSNSTTEETLDQIRTIIARPRPSNPSPSKARKRLLLCVAPYNPKNASLEESSSFSWVSPKAPCTFMPDVFMLPSSEADPEDSKASLLYGFEEWEDRLPHPLGGPVSFIGGTFTFKGVTSSEQYRDLCRALRLCLFVQISLVLEQQFLLDSRAPVTIQPPSPMSRPISIPPSSPSVPPRKHRHSFSPSSIISFISRHTPALRFSGGPEELNRSMDGMTYEQPPPPIEKCPGSAVPEGPDLPFALAVRRIQNCEDLLSTSFGVVIHPPKYLTILADREHKNPGKKLTGDEQTGLTSILGWAGKEDAGKRMTGMAGFLHQQSFSVLVSHYTNAPIPVSSQTDLPSSTLTSQSSASRLTRCGPPKLKTCRFYSYKDNQDRSLGDYLIELTTTADLLCQVPGCQYKQREHQSRFVHAGYRITVGVTPQTQSDAGSNEPSRPMTWESCAVCGAKNERIEMGDGAYLLSFAKFLELLIYSPTLCIVKPSLCEHTSPPPRPWGENLPISRLNIVRHFSTSGYNLSFSLFIIEDVFEVKIPRLQLTRVVTEKAVHHAATIRPGTVDHQREDQRKILRREIKRWWEGVSDHIDKLEKQLMCDDDSFIRKTLPRLPSTDDAYDILTLGDSTTPRATRIISFAQGYKVGVITHEPHNVSYSTLSNASHSTETLPSTTSNDHTLSSDLGAKELLSRMRLTFQQAEQSLYAQLSQTTTSVNDVRRSFLVSGKGAKKRLQAWQKKHKVSLGGQIGDSLSAEEPLWWEKGCHVLPGGDSVVREDDWGSIIAHTLGSPDYEHELTKMVFSRSDSIPAALPSPQSASSSILTASTGFRLFTSSGRSQLDPDQEGLVWEEPEAYSAVISRKEHPKDPASILSIRGVLAHRVADGAHSPVPRSASQGKPAAEHVPVTPPSAWTKPETQICTDMAERSDAPQFPDATVLAEKILQEVKSQSMDTQSSQSRHPSEREGENVGGSEIAKESQKEGHEKNPSTVSNTTTASTGTVTSNRATGKVEGLRGSDGLGDLPLLPPKDGKQPTTPGNSERSNTAQSSSSFTNTLTNGLSYAMRFVRSNEAPAPLPPQTGAHHALLSADTSRISDRPHIKYDWTVGNRLKFSCTVYYALQFDQLRRRCGIDDIFAKSLSRSTNWSAEGGKSKSNFWKTADDKFIIKTLVNAWNVADLQVLIDLAPSYFKYAESTANRASALAKMVGFYTIEIRNLETGNVQSKADLLVMENVFYERKIVKTFDLKGIHGRKVKASASKPSKTLFDGEWIEGQQKTLTLIQPHSKVILREALKHDAEFLAKSNIMDYSLLLGVDEENKHMTCGYTFAKTLEHKAKQGLNSGKEVTVVPPAEYQERFVTAIEGYFLACPDKWTKPLNGDVAPVNDPEQLHCPL